MRSVENQRIYYAKWYRRRKEERPEEYMSWRARNKAPPRPKAPHPLRDAVLALIARGFSQNEIARKLKVSRNSVAGIKYRDNVAKRR